MNAPGVKLKGYLLAAIGLILGMAAGFGVLILKGVITRELVALLADEAKVACNCEFKYDSISVSLLSLSATAVNPRIEHNGEARLQFASLKTWFSLSRFRENIILITEMELKKGRLDGFSPRSVPYKFIEQLVKPIPPELDRPDRWRVKLAHLNILDAKATETFGASIVSAEQIRLQLSRIGGDDFDLNAQIGQLTLASSDSRASESVNLGSVSAEALLDDEQTLIKSISLKDGDSILSLSGRAQDSGEIKGRVGVFFDTSNSLLREFIDAVLSGEGTIDGEFDRPQSIVRFSLIPESQGNILALGEPALNLTSLDALVQMHTSERDEFLLNVPELKFHGPQARFSLLSPLQIRSEQLRGASELRFELISIGGIEFRNGSLKLALSGTPANPGVQWQAQADSVITPLGPELSAVRSEGMLGSTVIKGEVSSVPKDGGELHSSFELARGGGANQQQLSADLNVRNYPVAPKGALTMNGKVALSGPLDLTQLVGDGKLTIDRNQAAVLSGDVGIKSGRLLAELETGSKRAVLKTSMDFNSSAQGALKIALSKFSLDELNPGVTCSDITANLQYGFSLSAPGSGEGAIDIDHFEVGCEPYRMVVTEGVSIPIQGGAAKFSKVLLTQSSAPLSEPSNILLNGGVSLESGFDLTASGSLNLQTLAGMARGVDDLLGRADLNVHFTGPLSSPAVLGSVTLQEGGVLVESANLELRNLNGKIVSKGDQLQFTDFTGRLNGGDLRIGGGIFFSRLADSTVKVDLSKVLFDPFESANVEVSAELSLGGRSASNLPLLQGNVVIDSAEFYKDLDMRFILQTMLSQLFRSGADGKGSIASEMPEAELDLKIRAPKNVQVTTNLAYADLALDIAIKGSTTSPRIEGDIRTVSGWFRVKDRKLEITSGSVQFREGLGEPQMSVIGETYVSSFYGQTSLVTVEVKGAITAPVVSFSSDLGLSQREIMDLLAHQGSISEVSMANAERRSLMAALDDPDHSIFDENLFTFIPRLLRELARLDSLSVEPTYSPTRASIDPTLIAARKITNRLELRGESAFSGDGTNASFGVFYRVTPGLTAVGKIESLPDQNATAFGADLVLSAFGQYRPFLQIEFIGNDDVDDLTLMYGAKLRDSSRLTYEDIPAVQENIERFYRNRGYLQVKASAQCVEWETFCRNLLVTVEEGKPSVAIGYGVELEDVTDSLNSEQALESIRKQVAKLPKDRQATVGLLARTKQAIVKGLRSDGYISARVTTSYRQANPGEITEDSDYRATELNLIVDISVSPGNPTTFIFKGNHAYSAKELLESINLFGRKQPFGGNTINILVDNITRLYRKDGYSKVDVQYEKSPDTASGRVTYVVEINEGPRLQIEEVLLDLEQSSHQLTARQIKDKLHELFPRNSSAVWQRGYFDPDKLAEYAEMVRKSVESLGYPQAKVIFDRSLPTEAGESQEVVITYVVISGEQFSFDRVDVKGLPEDFQYRPQFTYPLFIPDFNEKLNKLLVDLKADGYPSPSITTQYLDIAGAGRAIVVNVNLGESRVIGTISIEGLKEIAESVVRDNLRFASGERWEESKIEASRVALLRLGLFSQVKIEPLAEGQQSGVQDLVIHLTERPLQSIEVGSGVQSEFGFHLFTQATDRSLFGDGRSVSLRLDGYYDPVKDEIPFGIAGLQFVNPGVFKSDYSFIGDLRYQRVDLSTQEYNLDRVALAQYFTRSYDSPWTVAFGHTLLHDNLTDVNPGAVLSSLDTGTLYTSFISGSASYDRRNNRLNPTSGYFLGADSKLATKAIASDANFYELGGRAAYIKPFAIRSSMFSVAAHSRAISAWVFGGTPDVPITERFYLGGRTTVRGYRENSLGPRGDNGAIIGGDLSLLGNFEFRYHPYEEVQLLTFFDTGQVYLQERGVDLGDLRYSTGFGTRYLSPVGPIGIDVGFPLDQQPGEPSVRFSFTIGTQF